MNALRTVPRNLPTGAPDYTAGASPGRCVRYGSARPRWARENDTDAGGLVAWIEEVLGQRGA